MQAHELMTTDPAAVSPTASLQHVATLMVEDDCGAIPVVTDERNQPVGIVTDRDIVTRIVAQAQNPLNMEAREAMTHKPATVAPDTSLEDCAALMEENQVRRLLVVDNNNALRGIVAQADLAREIAQEKTGEVVEDVSQPTSAPSTPSRA